MAEFTRNGTLMKVVIGALTAFLLAAIVWIWNAAGYVKDVQVSQIQIAEAKSEIKDEIRPSITANRETVIGIKKDIERLDEKIDRNQKEQLSMQTQILTEIRRRNGRAE